MTNPARVKNTHRVGNREHCRTSNCKICKRVNKNTNKNSTNNSNMYNHCLNNDGSSNGLSRKGQNPNVNVNESSIVVKPIQIPKTHHVETIVGMYNCN